ncbi:MAG: hypothetical protein ABSB31_00210 [Dehalococcoidia bacterium]
MWLDKLPVMGFFVYTSLRGGRQADVAKLREMFAMSLRGGQQADVAKLREMFAMSLRGGQQADVAIL